MNDTRNMKKDKKQHIQVFVRVRPTNNAEKVGKSIIVIDIPSNKEVVIREKLHDKFTKKFTFDKVFGPNSKQLQVYNAVVSPLVQEVLAGYNCTVFAYGQTGTGKTFTMEGTDNDPSLHWQTDTNVGVIPRALSHLFDELRVLGVQEYSVRASFLELYNEELFDLLSPNDDATKIRIYEDPIKKGAVIVHGLEEIPIHNKIEVFNILQKGTVKRQTAATLMNAHSSRSHTIFSITVHLKENTVDGEELLKTGKLNLVDLAGSENVGRSGAVDRRAREAGNINQSLLTLGRVITALAEKTPHVPYRESKLTRLLQESLGGRTRTSIIATISPASINLEETLSTLDYAYRAKNITNRPEINQKFSKRALLQEYMEEIERLKKDLIACRERNGIYLTPDSYNEMQCLIEFQSKEIEEKLNHIKALEECMNSKEQIFNELKSRNSEQANELLNVKSQLESTVNALMSTSSRLAISEREKEEQKYLVEKHTHTENILLSQVQTVLDVADTAISDVNKLHDKVFRKMQIGQQNKCLGQQFKHNIQARIKNIEADITTHNENFMQFCAFIKNYIGIQNGLLIEDIDKSIQVISQDFTNFNQNIHHELVKNINDSYLRYQQWLENEDKNVATVTDKKLNMLNDISDHITQRFQQLIENKIAEDLHGLNTHISQQTDDLIESTKEIVTWISKCSVEERDCLNNKILEIKEHIKNIQYEEDSIIEKQKNFAKMMDDLQCCFNAVRKEEEENRSSVRDILNNIDQTCEIINNHALDTCRINIEKQNDLQERLENNLKIVKQVVDEETNKDVYLKVYTICNEHTRCLSDCKMAFINVSKEMSQKLESKNINAASMSSTIIVEIQAILDQINKFFTEDLYRDIPTGLTPAKKDFQYPKKLMKTSPHERLLKRYRETLSEIEHTEN
ncbi:hypothetical protein WN48_09369 [Eufriesea mexicana]|nr:hypothetical protein WN48_09369 [Eufriesea mexicana]